MSRLTNVVGQQEGIIWRPGQTGAASTALLVVPTNQSRTYLIIENTHATATLWVDTGPARATAVVSGGAVTSVTVNNAGFGYKVPPTVEFYGGAQQNGGGWGFKSPSPGASAGSAVSSGTISAVTVNGSGTLFLSTPDVYLRNDPNDSQGCAAPNGTAAPPQGISLNPGGSYVMESSRMSTDQLAVWSSNSACTFTYGEMF